MTATSEMAQDALYQDLQARSRDSGDTPGGGSVYRAMLDARTLLDSSALGREEESLGYRCIAFRIGGELYAVDLATVREVILPPEILPVPGAGREVLGVINLRGSIVTVVNSRTKLGLQGRPEGAEAKILVLDEGSGYVGALVDAVEDIIHVRVEDLEAVRGTSEPRIEVGGALTIGEEIAFIVRADALVTRSGAGN